MKHTKIVSIFAVPFLAVALATTIFAKTIYFTEGEQKDVPLQISERDSASFTIDSATYWIKDEGGTIVLSETSADISDGTKILARVNATSWTEGSTYTLYIHWETAETTEKFISPVKIFVSDDYL